MPSSSFRFAPALSPASNAPSQLGIKFSTIDVLRKMSEEGRLPIRLWMMVLDSNERLKANLARARVIGAANGHFTVRAIKKQIDGALGSRGAWLLEPYAGWATQPERYDLPAALLEFMASPPTLSV